MKFLHSRTFDHLIRIPALEIRCRIQGLIRDDGTFTKRCHKNHIDRVSLFDRRRIPPLAPTMEHAYACPQDLDLSLQVRHQKYSAILLIH